MGEIIITVALLVIALAVFGLRQFLFGDQSPIANRENIKKLLTGENQESMLRLESVLMGKTGVTHTVLKPGGKALIEDELYEVTTLGEFIDKGTPVKVIGVMMGNVLKVRALKSHEILPTHES
jgi:membrane-bound serine protease (ClpP class)